MVNWRLGRAEHAQTVKDERLHGPARRRRVLAGPTSRRRRSATPPGARTRWRRDARRQAKVDRTRRARRVDGGESEDRDINSHPGRAREDRRGAQGAERAAAAAGRRGGPSTATACQSHCCELRTRRPGTSTRSRGAWPSFAERNGVPGLDPNGHGTYVLLEGDG